METEGREFEEPLSVGAAMGSVLTVLGNLVFRPGYMDSRYVWPALKAHLRRLWTAIVYKAAP